MGLMVAAGVAEVVTVATVLESVAAVGAALSVVGMVTKNKTLSMVGAGLGLVGGVGALAAGAMGVGNAALFGAQTAASTAGDAAAVASAGDSAFVTGTAAGDAAMTASDVGVGAMGGGAAGDALTTATTGFGASGVPDAVGALSGVPANAADPAEQLTFASQSANPADAVAPGTTGGVDAGAAPTATTAVTPPPSAPSPGSGLSVTGNPELNTPAAATEGAANSDTGMFGGILKFANAHPAIAFGAVQAGGSLLSGLTSTLTPAQVSALNAQAAANDAAAALTKQQTANLAMPKAVASSAPVTGAPAPLVPGAAGAGFINQAPKQPLIAGVPS